MILPTFVLPGTANQQLTETGTDCLNRCLNKTHWRTYPNSVDYRYNSRGFRDTEWPDDLINAVWCFGDSYTVGIGAPFNHIWPQLLACQTNQHTINISIDGASNNWMARKIMELSHEIIPKKIIIHWSFTHRREADKNSQELKDQINQKWFELYNKIKDPTWPTCKKLEDFKLLPNEIQQEILNQHTTRFEANFIQAGPGFVANYFDEYRRLHYSKDLDKNVVNTIECIKSVHESLPTTNIVHSFVPDFDTGDNVKEILAFLTEQNYRFVPPFSKLDLSRDGLHYDIKTAQALCNNLIKLI